MHTPPTIMGNQTSRLLLKVVTSQAFMMSWNIPTAHVAEISDMCRSSLLYILVENLNMVPCSLHEFDWHEICISLHVS